ncbi:aspartate carbamoyltransferase [Aestuariimicrobium kwangyangense]|uniref:aspartate carbamoyltransferase n=1 Tax=Aestuariimicrobium kwangyangense TaxID=396389 RepID=UPI0003B4E535|nr:aspartate carbamoyltransferase [Aestuariimicrobium kwangyangense]
MTAPDLDQSRPNGSLHPYGEGELFGKGKHLLSVSQFDRPTLVDLFTLADTVAPIAQRQLGRGDRQLATGQTVCSVLDGAVLGSLFFEPSTRTRLSFESAFLRLGGEVTTTTGFTFSSMAKGESIEDTSRVVSGYSDVLVVRHPDEGSVAQFAAASVVPVINAGDGAGEHPSQALLDLYTLEKELGQRGGTVDGSTIAVVGDLRHGRTVHSLLKLLTVYRDVSVRLFAPESLELPDETARHLTSAGHRLTVCDTVVEALRGADAVYTTRVQRERITGEVPASIQGNLIDRSVLAEADALDIVIMHPLPRDSRHDAYDLSSDVDDLPGLAIFHQTDNGVNVRMAIFLTALGCSPEMVRVTTKQRPWDATLHWNR